MSKKNDGIHVTTNPKGTGWVSQGNGVIYSSHDTKGSATAEGRAFAKRYGVKLTIHRRNGTVAQTHAYGVGPLPGTLPEAGGDTPDGSEAEG